MDRGWKAKVYRLRGLPASVRSSDEAASLLAAALQLHVAEIIIRSLASDIDIYNSLRPKVATVMFKTAPDLGRDIRNAEPPEEWCVEVNSGGTLYSLSIDTHFRGLTPLCDVEEEKHIVDCIAISGLSSHPFGSWAPPGSDKSFMWIRDSLPSAIPGLRPILYGYNSDLNNGNSFQTLSGIATSLIGQIGSSGWKTLSGRQIVFLAHSLGGLVLKDAILQLANSPNDFDQFVLQKFIGVLLFGVPNRGMNQRAFLQVTKGQLNEHLIEDLGTYMPHLLAMDDRFRNIATGKNISIYWFHEGQTSPITVRDENGQLSRGTEREILVTSRSATSAMLEKCPEKTFQVNETHSNMVKFPSTSEYLRVVFDRISTIMKIHNPGTHQAGTSERNSTPATWVAEPEVSPSNKSELEAVLRSLNAPDLDMRQSSIEKRSGHTFDWIFDQTTFTEWLQDGNGMFWIKGKPASGKSTIMRFLYEDRRTEDFLNTSLHRHLIQAGFFFHYRGSALQKSFEGLIRSVTCQLISKKPKLLLLDEVHQCFPSASQLGNGAQTPSYWTHQRLKKLLLGILGQRTIKLDICLFLDALDEFDGPPEVISRFLSQLISTSNATGSPHSLRILASSRPWPAFEAEFKDSKTITLHEHTKKDIRSFCEDRISAATEEYRLVKGLIDEIVDNARGSFLWVKLLLDNMLREQSPWHKTSGTASAAEILSSSKDLLSVFPEELDDYYRETFLRMKSTHRYETYALFEILTRKQDKGFRSLAYVLQAVRCAQSHTWEEARAAIDQTSSLDLRPDPVAQMAFLETWSGGLVEVVGKRFPDNQVVYEEIVQLVHQTVFEFVTRVDFKELVLQSSAALHNENGYSYLAKWRMARCHGFDTEGSGHIWDLMRNARLSEETTGKSQREFICSIPINTLQRLCRDGLFLTTAFGLDSVEWNSHLAFAISLRLRTLMQELCELMVERRQHFKTESSLLTGMAFFCIHGGELPQVDDFKASISMAHQLLDMGYDASRERCLIANLLTLNTEYVQVAGHNKLSIGALEGFVMRLVRSQPALLALSIELKDFQERDEHAALRPYKYQRGAKVSPLHLAWHPEKVSILLRCGADPNLRDNLGNTPLDVLLSLPKLYKRYAVDDWPLTGFCVAAVLLLRAGGGLHNMSRKKARKALALFEPVSAKYLGDNQEGGEAVQIETKEEVRRFWEGIEASFEVQSSLDILRRALEEYWDREGAGREGKQALLGRLFSFPLRHGYRKRHAQ